MRLSLLAPAFSLLSVTSLVAAQPQRSTFEVASVRPSQREVGPDYNNQISYSGDRFIGKNVTLKRLVAEAWHCQMNQVVGPSWLDRKEYDVEARVPPRYRPRADWPNSSGFSVRSISSETALREARDAGV